MALQFNNNGLEIDTFRDLFQTLSDAYKDIYGQDIDLDQESPDGQRVAIEAQARTDIEASLQWLYSQMDPDFNTGDMQQIIAKLHGLYLRPGSRSQRDLNVATDRPVFLYSGYKIRDQSNQVWFVRQNVTIPAGTTTVTFFAQDFGKVTGLIADTFTQLTPELGVLSITSDAVAVVGRDEETPEEFRQRRNRSLENPATGSTGAIFAKVAQLTGVTDLNVGENDTKIDDVLTGIPANSIWLVAEGGAVSEIVEVMVKQKGGGTGTKGSVIGRYIETLIRPDGTTLQIAHDMQFDRPVYKPLHINLTAKRKVTNDPVDLDTLKEALAKRVMHIGEEIDANEFYADGYGAGRVNYVLTNLKISINGITFTDAELSPGFQGKFTLDVANISITEVT
ncbi:TPA: baseplate J/gp47 family protein [Yersinia enterocolitica]|uniref:baseplate J/gp47 family protein n=1 Tax=Yersinia enterocolitica TaxID=630 RepID=UPI001E565563|nr:baseplate J/gp47 family protein [Yersinia enterocolitica]ELI8120970.1 baseplate J/gp47 family protein [Yersinia enterocolitica]MCE3111059.1 baseplate J/gp47 family protein [Yersinia enterocolitica]HDL7019591.1 baseplate J/gp47 family protein [Yersinia enterocolitica]HDL7414153.1 baseplate J/gp47 family protein [Yersinia enterocolitica]HDL7940996.1 baseplate J/gp47 family protein [Yersinia enterocolitica]